MEQRTSRPRGRPQVPPEERKRYPLNMRTTREIRERLEYEAAISGRSLAQEAEYRLQRSFDIADVRYEDFGGREQYRLMRFFSFLIEEAERDFGAKWHEDSRAKEAVKQVALEFFDRFGPKISSIAGKKQALEDRRIGKEIFEDRIAALSESPTAKKKGRK